MSLKQSPPVRVFTKDKVIESKLLNRMGVQVMRTLAARSLYNVRPSHATPDLKDKIADLRRDGMVLYHDFLEPEHFQAVKNECLGLLKDHPEKLDHLQHGPTHIELCSFSKFPKEEYTATEKFLSDPRLVGLLKAGEKINLEFRHTHRALEHVIQGPAEEKDPETDMHSDIFFHTHKAWLYLSDVEEKDSPLCFVKGTHQLTLRRCKEIYRHSNHPLTPSRRISPEEFAASGQEETVLTVPANTLVVANVSAYHRRKAGQPGGERWAIIISTRSHPFAWWKSK